MATNTAQVLRQVIREELKPIDQRLGKVEGKLDGVDKRLRRVEDKVDALSGDIEQLHMDVKGIRDKEGMAHSRNKREIDEIKTHLGLPLMPDVPEVYSYFKSSDPPIM